MKGNLNGTTVHIKFRLPVDSIEYIVASTGKQEKITVASGTLNLIKGRLYYVPVDTNIDSDNFNILKIFSSLADKIDVKFVKDGFACIEPLIHNTQIKNQQQLCGIWN